MLMRSRHARTHVSIIDEQGSIEKFSAYRREPC